MARITNAGVTIDISRTRSDLEKTKKAVEDAIIEAIRSKLNDLLRKLKEESSNRQSQLENLGVETEHAEDNPFSGAYVQLTRSGGKRKVTVAHRSERSDKNLFNILDKGRKRVTKSKAMVFPAYKPRTQRTSPNNFDLKPAKTLTGELVFTKSIKGFKGRNYYERIAKQVVDEWPGYVEVTVNGRKTRVEVNTSEFSIEVV